MAFTPDLPSVHVLSLAAKRTASAAAKLGAVAWHQPQGMPEVLHEIALS